MAYVEQGNKIWLPLYQGRLAEIEADGEGIEEALARIDGALALAAGKPESIGVTRSYTVSAARFY